MGREDKWSSIPEPNTSNTAKDLIVLEYLDNFHRQFSQLYPDRPKLLLHPKNEHGAEKLVTTFIRPTKLPYKDVYDYQDTARFISDHLLYAPLSAPPHTSRSAVEPPTMMRSPTAVLANRGTTGAHCFEFATVLVSVLLGVGYDAYCVYGYATRPVTLQDQRNSSPPFALDCRSSASTDPTTISERDEANESSSYEAFVTKKPYLQSNYLKNKEEKHKESEKNEKTKLEDALHGVKLEVNGTQTGGGDGRHGTELKNAEAKDKDVIEAHRIHCWVLLLPGKREVQTPTFIEPTTGLVIPPNSTDYLGVEAVWNDSNYWLNMQTIRPKTLHNIAYELGNTYKWEAVFLDPDQPVIGKPPAKYSVHSGRKGDTELEILRCPTTWVSRIEISKHEFLTRFPNGKISVDYKLCTVEKFAEYHRDDGMVKHVTMYEDEARKKVVEYREFFANRKDFLEQRRRIVGENMVWEFFARGRLQALKEYIKTPTRQEFVFIPSIRIDGLARRVEYFGKKTAETYSGRDDFMIYRCVSFSNDKNMESIRLSDTESSLPMRKITEKFERNSALPADEDIQKINFAMDQKKILITYHRDSGRITAARRIYTKEGKSKDFQVDPFAAKPTARQLAADLQKMTWVERDCIQKLRDTDREANEIRQSRTKEEAAIELTTNIHDTWRGGKNWNVDAEEPEKDKWSHKDSEGEDGGPEETGKKDRERERDYDPLAVHLRMAENKPMTRDMAIQIKESALRTLKERLIQKANLIHSRLEKETNSLLRLQTNHQRGKDNQEAVEDDTDYERQTHEAMFRIRVLEERLTRHEKMALEKFQALDRKIMADPRLADFL